MIRLLLLALLMVVACGENPQPPPSTTTTVPPPPTPTTTVPEPQGRQPDEYVNLDRVPSLAIELGYELQENAWAGWRDPLYVITHCSWSLQPNERARFDMTEPEMRSFANEGGALDADGAGFLERLPMVNRRCEPAHPEHSDRFCGRSEVRRDRLSEFRSRLTGHLLTARSLRDAVRWREGDGPPWDSIAGWCQRVRAQ